jgi:hypothetical protein
MTDIPPSQSHPGWQATVGMARHPDIPYIRGWMGWKGWQRTRQQVYRRTVSYFTLVVVNSHKFISYPDWYLVILSTQNWIVITEYFHPLLSPDNFRAGHPLQRQPHLPNPGQSSIPGPRVTL